MSKLDLKYAMILLMDIKKAYVYSEVTSGEFIHSLKFHYKYGVNELRINKEQVEKAVQDFLDWDDSPETFELRFVDDHFVIR